MTKHIDPNTEYNALVDALRQQLGKAVLSPGEALALAGSKAKDPESAAQQRIQHGRYPYPLVHVGRSPAVLVTAIARTLLGMPADAEPEPEQTPRKRPGRPRKNAKRAGGAA